MKKQEQFFIINNKEDHEQRIDIVLARQYPHHTRSFFARLIADNLVLINNHICKKSGTKIKIGDTITIQFPEKPLLTNVTPFNAPELDVSVIFEHEHFLIINKPAGLLVHQTNQYDLTITLVDWLLYHYPILSSIGYQGRPGIVHRLDKDTSGLLLIPKTNLAHTFFTNAFKNRTILKEYWAIVSGNPERHFILNFPIGRDPHHKTKMKAFKNVSDLHNIIVRTAQTEFFLEKYFKNTTLLLVKPTTGRTHQIRVHLATYGYPIIGDTVYGTSSLLISRHALHSKALSFEFQNQQFRFESDFPTDIQNLLTHLSTP